MTLHFNRCISTVTLYARRPFDSKRHSHLALTVRNSCTSLTLFSFARLACCGLNPKLFLLESTWCQMCKPDLPIAQFPWLISKLLYINRWLSVLSQYYLVLLRIQLLSQVHIHFYVRTADCRAINLRRSTASLSSCGSRTNSHTISLSLRPAFSFTRPVFLSTCLSISACVVTCTFFSAPCDSKPKCPPFPFGAMSTYSSSSSNSSVYASVGSSNYTLVTPGTMSNPRSLSQASPGFIYIISCP